VLLPQGPSTRTAADAGKAPPQPSPAFAMTESMRCVTTGHRQAATELLERTGPRGVMVDDIVEVSAEDVIDKHAISHWRMCSGVRFYRSESATKALRLLCAAQVPGLNGTSYLEVFQTLTCSSWTSHIFLMGGLVRDILRRIVGRDIDVNFSASAKELARICQEKGYEYRLDCGDEYICIGDYTSGEFIEGFAVTRNPPQAFTADFSMNQLYYDFCNDLVIDKTGYGVSSLADNLCELPCPRAEWDAWLGSNGPRVLFRYYKFLLRGFSYSDESMAYVAKNLLHCWATIDEDELFAIGRLALDTLVACSDTRELDALKDLVFKSFDVAMPTIQGTSLKPPEKKKWNSQNLSKLTVVPHSGSPSSATPDTDGDGAAVFLSAGVWWKWGWAPLLKLPEPAAFASEG